MPFDDACDIGVLVFRQDEKPAGIAAHRLVLPPGHLKRLAAVLVRTFADEGNEARVLFGEVAEPSLEFVDPLVDLAEDNLVLCAPQLFDVQAALILLLALVSDKPGREDVSL